MAGLLDLFTGNQNGAGILGLPPNVAGPLQNAFSPLQAALQQIATPGLLAQQQASQQFNQMLPQLLGQQMPSAAPQMPSAPAPNFGNAIASIESGGKYDALGPETKGDRAYGKYQVMGKNIGPWTQEVLGRPMTPQEFIANPQAQDQVFQAKFGQYAQKYGPEGAARAWFAGEGGMNNPNAKDILGTTVASYAQKFNSAMGGPQSPGMAPQMAQAAPQMAQAQQPAMSPKVMGLIRMLSIPNLPDAQKKVAETLLQNELLQSRGTDDIKEFEYAKRQGFTGTLEQWVQRKRHGGGEFGLQLFWGRDAQGNPVAMQPGKSGEAVQTKLPPGVSLSSKEAQKLDAGTHWVLIDPLTRQQVGIIPKNIAEKEEAEKVGAARGTAKVALPAAETTTNRAIKMLDQIEKHPGFSQGVGFIIGRLPALTPQAADFRERVEQIDAMVFGEAVEVMRGLGALTDKEGPKVSAARARLKTAKSEEDFRTALKDIRDVFNDGIANMRKKAGMSSGQVSDPLGIR